MCKLCSGEKNQVIEDSFYSCGVLKETSSWDCTSLEEVPKGTVFEGEANFSGHTSLKEIHKDTVFRCWADFRGCESLEEIHEGTVFRSRVIFEGCESLKEISDGVTFEHVADFTGCKSLKKISAGATFNGWAYFKGCTSLDLNSLIKANMKARIYISVDMGDKKEWEKQWRAIDEKAEYGLTVSIINKNTNGTVQFETLEQAIAFRKGELVGRKAFEIKNAELRMVVLQEVGFEEVIKDYNLELVDFSDAGKLWKSKTPIDEGVPDVEPQILAVFGGIDPAKGEMCYLRTNPEAQTADEGKLATFPLAGGVYKKTGEMPAFIYES